MAPHQGVRQGRRRARTQRYLTRGSKIALTGSIRYSKWTDKYEQTRTSTDIFLDEFTFLESKDRGASEAEEALDRDSVMQVAEPSPTEAASSPAKTKKRRAIKKSTKSKQAATAAEDLPF